AEEACGLHGFGPDKSGARGKWPRARARFVRHGTLGELARADLQRPPLSRLRRRVVARVVAHYRPDVVALQEVDIGHARTGHAAQPAVLAALLGMQYCFHPAFGGRDEHYGDAILSRHPLRLVRAAALPTLPDRPHLELRGALWAAVSWNGRAVQVLNT